MICAGLLLLHPVLITGLIIVDAAAVPEGGASHHVNHYQDDQNDDVDQRRLPPALLDVGQNPDFAGVAVVVQLLLFVAPLVAVGVVPTGHPSAAAVPISLVHVWTQESGVTRPLG
ncbi:hypothetical protein U1Q18_010964, partial [Sarracenia purpurea var. burkii]